MPVLYNRTQHDVWRVEANKAFSLCSGSSRDAVVLRAALPPSAFLDPTTRAVKHILTIQNRRGPEMILAVLDANNPVADLDLFLLNDDEPIVRCNRPVDRYIAAVANSQDLLPSESSIPAVLPGPHRALLAAPGETVSYSQLIRNTITSDLVLPQHSVLNQKVGDDNAEVTLKLIDKPVGAEVRFPVPAGMLAMIGNPANAEMVLKVEKLQG
ncbi:hypothetical protein A4X09_0g5876 [Tilletia walkeri]|uniref:Uncharacterized protein n=1 Tax=Tilletia walkeri TaxID=117179 RepID=A0A8X7T380_9BASI|nr:hypothetical protein A4X09_0g5876 [Tilletia walkeri]